MTPFFGSVAQWPLFARKLSLIATWFDASVGAFLSRLYVKAPGSKHKGSVTFFKPEISSHEDWFKQKNTTKHGHWSHFVQTWSTKHANGNCALLIFIYWMFGYFILRPLVLVNSTVRCKVNIGVYFMLKMPKLERLYLLKCTSKISMSCKGNWF